MTSSHHGPYAQGDTHATMHRDSEKRACEGERIYKAVRSTDWRLQLVSMKLESLVIADQPRRGEYVPGPCTHRPSSHGSCVCLKVGVSTLPRVGVMTGAKS